MPIRTFVTAASIAFLMSANALAQENSEKDPPRRGLLQRPGNQDPGGPGQRGEGLRGNNQRGEFPRPDMGPDGMAQRMAGMLRMSPLMRALDLDEDGVLSKQEIENASKSLMKLDKNGDGSISAEELRPDPAQMPGGEGPGAGPGSGNGPLGVAGALAQQGPQMLLKMFDSRDTNGDGKLSGDEIPERMRDRVAMIDQDGDGAIDKKEVEKAIARMGDRMPGGRPGREEQNGQGVRPRRPPTDGNN